MDEKKVNFKNMTLPQLEDLRARQLLVLKNKKILNKLADKGEQTKKFLDKIQIEIEERKNLIHLEQQMKSLDLNSNGSETCTVKYLEHMCNIERNDEDVRFKPFRIMSPKKTHRPVEVHKPTQLLALRESVELQEKQEARVQEEHVRIQYRRIAKEVESGSETEDSSDEEEGSEVEHENDEK